MNNLFKKGFASLALVSAMTSSIFGGNASYIDVRINYLSGIDKAVLGHESANVARDDFASSNKSDLVELYIRVLDADGQFADKDANGKTLANIRVLRNGNNADNFTDGLIVPSNILTNIIQRGLTSASSIATKAILNRNAGRYTLDYTDVNVAELVDSLTILAGTKTRNISIDLTSRDARGLIVRSTAKDQLSSAGGIINQEFDSIAVAGLAMLDDQANDIAQVLASKTDKVPLRVYASTLGANTETGRFTIAPNLEGKTIVVVALGDYSADGTTDTYITHTELNMTNGVARGEIALEYGLPDRNGSGATGHNDFGAEVGGLGVSFIAYVKDTTTINSGNANVVLSPDGVYRVDVASNLEVSGDDNATDNLKVRSGYITGYKIGLFTPLRDTVARYFRDRSYVFLANATGLDGANQNLARETINVTGVDALGNPGSIGVQIVDGDVVGTNTPLTVKIGNPAAMPFTLNGGVSSDDINISRGDTNMTTNVVSGITAMELNVTDLVGGTATTQTVMLAFNGPLSGTSPAVFTVSTVDVVGNTPDDTEGGLEDRNLITSVRVPNLGQTTNTQIHTEQTRENDYVDMVVNIKVDSVTTDGNITLLAKVNRVDNGEFNGNIKIYEANDTATATALVAIGTTNAPNTGWYTLEYNTTQNAPVMILGDYAVDPATTVALTDGNISFITLANPNLGGNLANWIASVGSVTKIRLKGSQRGDAGLETHLQNVDAYLQTTTTVKGAEDFVGRTTGAGKPGDTIIDFDFSGNMVTQNVGNTVATITFGGSDGTTVSNTNILAGIVGQPFLTQNTIKGRANTNVVTAPISPSGRLSIALYGAYTNDLPNRDANTTLYNIQSVTINELVPVFTSRDRNDVSTPKAIDIDINQDINVTIEVGDKKVASKVWIRGIGTTSEGEGQNGDRATALPEAASDDLLEYPNGLGFGAVTANEVQTDPDTEIFTNLFYTLFDNNNDLRISDKFNNEINMESIAIADNYTFTMSDPACAIVKMNGGASATDPATIKFEDCAAGKPQSLIITAKGNENASNKINFTNIVKQVENTKLNISLNVGSTDYNVANNDILVKIIGDGNTDAVNTIISVKNTDAADAEIVIMPVDLIGGKPFGTIVPSGSTLKQNIGSTGSYYVIRSDKAGNIEVKANAVILKKDAVARVDTPIEGTLTFKVSLMDNNAPVVMVKSTSSGVTVTVNDLNLDTKRTMVEIYDIKGNKVNTKVTMGASGVYTASISKGGAYSARVHAVDLAGNINNISPLFVIGDVSGAGVAILEDSLVAHGSYEIDGKFASHDFDGVDEQFDWAYATGDKVYQLNAKDSEDTSAFKWGEVTDVTVGDTNAWSMIRLTGDTGSVDEAGAYGWVLVNAKGDAYKLAGANNDGTFNFSKSLYVKGTISGSNVSFAKR